MSSRSLTFSRRFPYRDIGTGWKPIIICTIYFGSNTEGITYPMLVDSGAETVLLPARWGLELGIDFSTRQLKLGRSAAGAGTLQYWEVDGVTVEIAEWIRLTCCVRFSPQMDDHSYGLLGREGIFDRLLIGFRESIGEFYLGLDDKMSSRAGH